MSDSEPKLEDLLGIKFRWPTRGDRLFAPAAHWTQNAEIHAEAAARNYFMTSGYKEAADHMINVTLKDRVEGRYLIYPIVFCYRQFIELSLKNQLADYGGMAGIEPPKRGHDLKALLRAFRKMCRELHGRNDETLIVVSKCILEFARMDPTSFTFRYATNSDGTPYKVSTDQIDLARLKDVMDAIASFFVGSDGYFSEMASAQPYEY